jgi:hypothetical protein
VVRIHSPRPTFSNTYRHFQYSDRVQTGSILDPILTRMPRCAGRCRRVLFNLMPADFEDPLGSYQEVWRSTRCVTSVVRDYRGHHVRDAKHDAILSRAPYLGADCGKLVGEGPTVCEPSP